MVAYKVDRGKTIPIRGAPGGLAKAANSRYKGIKIDVEQEYRCWQREPNKYRDELEFATKMWEKHNEKVEIQTVIRWIHSWIK